jgi:hypothetical protein
MRIFFLLLVSLIILVNCGKKSDPQYQSKIIREIKII